MKFDILYRTFDRVNRVTESGFRYEAEVPVKKPKVLEGNSVKECFEKFYEMNNSLRYCNGRWYEFANGDDERHYNEWLLGLSKEESFELYYGNGTVD